MHMCLRLLRYGCLSTVVLFGSCTPMKVSEGNAAVQGISRQQIVGSWGSVVTDDGFGSKVLVVQFDKGGGYTFTWVGPLPLVQQTSGSQPAIGEVETGRYRIRVDTIYFDSAGSSGAQHCRVTTEKGVLVLAFDENRVYALTRLGASE